MAFIILAVIVLVLLIVFDKTKYEKKVRFLLLGFFVVGFVVLFIATGGLEMFDTPGEAVVDNSSVDSGIDSTAITDYPSEPSEVVKSFTTDILYANPFYEGRAWVECFNSDHNEKRYALIDNTGKILFSFYGYQGGTPQFSNMQSGYTYIGSSLRGEYDIVDSSGTVTASFFNSNTETIEIVCQYKKFFLVKKKTADFSANTTELYITDEHGTKVSDILMSLEGSPVLKFNPVSEFGRVVFTLEPAYKYGYDYMNCIDMDAKTLITWDGSYPDIITDTTLGLLSYSLEGNYPSDDSYIFYPSIEETFKANCFEVKKYAGAYVLEDVYNAQANPDGTITVIRQDNNSAKASIFNYLGDAVYQSVDLGGTTFSNYFSYGEDGSLAVAIEGKDYNIYLTLLDSKGNTKYQPVYLCNSFNNLLNIYNIKGYVFIWISDSNKDYHFYVVSPNGNMQEIGQGGDFSGTPESANIIFNEQSSISEGFMIRFTDQGYISLDGNTVLNQVYEE